MRKKAIVLTILCLLLCMCAIGFTACGDAKASYSVKFLNDDGTQIGATQTVNFGEELTVPENPTKDGYYFVGWTVDGILYDFEADFSKKVEKDMTFTAKYEVLFTVSFYDGETLIGTKTVGKDSRVVPIEFSKKGYTFNFWQKEGADTAFNFNSVITENVKLIANVTANKYTVKFFDEDGVTPLGGDNAEQTLEYGTEFVVPDDPAKEHKIFVGWQLSGGEEIVDFSAEGAKLISDEDLTYVAKYKFETYKVTFYAEDGTTVLYETQVEYGKIPEYKGADLVKTEEGAQWEFNGWTPILSAADKDTSYTACFRKVTVTQESGGDTYDNDRDDWFE